MTKEFYILLLLLSLSMYTTTIGLCADKTGDMLLSSDKYLFKTTFFQPEPGDSVVFANMNWKKFLNSCIHGERAQMMGEEFDHKLKLISYKKTDNINLSTKDSLLIRQMNKHFLTPVAVQLDSAKGKFKMVKFTRIYKKSISEYNKIKKEFIKKYYKMSGDNQLKLFNLKWSYAGKFFRTQLFVTQDSQYLYDDLFFYLYCSQNTKETKSKINNWEDLFNSIIDGEKCTSLSGLFNQQLRLISYKVIDTINIFTKDSLLIKPITDETLVPVSGSQIQQKDSNLHMHIDFSNPFFKTPGSGMKVRVVSKKVIPTYKLVKISDAPMPNSFYTRTRKLILKAFSKKFGSMYKLIRLTWNYKRKEFHTQAFVSQATNMLTYDIILISLQSIGTNTTKIMTKGEITKKMKSWMGKKKPELSSPIKEIKYPPGEGKYTLSLEEIQKISSNVSGIPKFLKAYVKSYATVLGFQTCDNKQYINQKYLDKFNLEVQTHLGLFKKASGAKRIRKFKRGNKGFLSYFINYAFKNNTIPITFEGSSILQYGIYSGLYYGFLTTEDLR